MNDIKTKRVFDKADPKDGFRILVDKVWPRGVKKEDACLNIWMRDISPSKELRRWFDHDPNKWEEFKMRYRTELLETKKKMFVELKELVKENQPATLLYGARDAEHNNAVALKEFIKDLSE